MANASFSAPTAIDSLQAAWGWPTAFADNLLQVQRMQMEALLSWQQSLASINEELWDEWVCRWGGGVPIAA